jgi:hypothetical protein
VLSSLITGFVLLPEAGMQRTVLAATLSASAAIPLLALSATPREGRAAAISSALVVGALALWLT